MAHRVIIVVGLLLLAVAPLVADPAPTKLKVRVTHYGHPGDPRATANTRLGLGDHNNILNKDSVAVSPDLDRVFPFGSKVVVNGQFVGYRHDTTPKNLQRTIAVYDPNGEWKADFDGQVEVPPKKK
jgi:3D (Asp-Asp-Asp) domain-containing protein